MKELQSDILIIGAGLTGLTAAFALSSLKKRILVVDKFDFTKKKNDNLDLRTTAIAEGSKNFFQDIGIWNKIKEFIQPIELIKVLDRSDKRKIDFYNKDKKENLGYIIKNNILKNILIKSLQTKKNIKFIQNINLNSISYKGNFVIAKFNKVMVKSELILAADGKNSTVRNILKTPLFKKKYNHSALVINFNHNKNHNNTAYEIFFNSGPLAILPMKKTEKGKFSSSVIWTNDDSYASQVKNINKNFLKLILEEKIKQYVGNIIEIVDVQKFNLSAHLNSKFYSRQTIYVGDSAHSIHPIAGQGWNLGVRDIKNCLEVIKSGLELGLLVGDQHICKKYHAMSFTDSYMLYQITDKLNTLFLYDNLFINQTKDIGFKLIQNTKKINNFITNFAMGV